MDDLAKSLEIFSATTIEAFYWWFSRQTRNDNVDIKNFLQSFSYISLTLKKNSDYHTLLKTVKDLEDKLGIPENRMFYLSVAPELIHDISLNIYIRTGKRMKEKSTKIVIEFINNDTDQLPNCMVISINPNEALSLKMNMKNPFNGEIEPVKVNYYNNQHSVPETYELLLFDALKGDSTFFAHWREVELSWQWVQPVLEAFEENNVPLYFYESGSLGHVESTQLVQEDGFKWW